MNKIHNIIWSTARSCWVVVAEGTKASSKSGAKALKVMLALLVFPAGAMAATLPQGGSITVGNGSIVTNGGNQMVIKQISDKLGINWQSFSVGPDGHVIFDQPGKDSIALNRVIGRDGSSILGKIDANGQVFLINPNGVIFGKGAEVNVGGLVASTLNISDEDFKNGNFKFKAGADNGAILNEGSLHSAEGGYVALLGKSVKNNGVIQAKLGSVALAAGSAVSLDFAGDGLINLQVDQSAVNALAENKGLIKADGGNVLMTARASNALTQTVVNNEGVIQAQTIGNRAGKIFLDGGFESGSVAVAGTLDASAPDSGNGGFIETSGLNVNIAKDVKVTTLAKNGAVGDWLIDPTDFNINAGDDAQTLNSIGANTLSDKLESTNVTIATMGVATPGELGDINVNSAVSWGANTKLTLNAHNDINIKDTVSINGDTGSLALNYSGRVNVINGGSVKLNGANTAYSENGNAFQILRTATDLNQLTGAGASNKFFALGGDIDASVMSTWNGGKGFDGYGDNDSTYTSVFKTVFNGLGNTINDFYVNRPTENYVGLFGVFSNGTLSNLNINGTVIGKGQTGMVAGQLSAANVYNVNTSGTVKGDHQVGGAFGYAYANKLIDNINSSVNVTGDNDEVGGIIGYSYSDILVSKLRYSGAVKGHSKVGGLIGSSYADITLKDFATTSTTTVEGDTNVGGAVGYISDFASASDISGSGTVSGNSSVGGAFGYAHGTMNNIKSDANVSGNNAVGGLIGELYVSKLNSAFATGSVTGTASYTGGLVGKSTQNIVSNLLSTGEVKGNQDVGGLFGASNFDQIKTSFSTSKVTGANNVGGFGGNMTQSIITDAYATGEVDASASNSGGFAGKSYYTNYKYTYSTGKNSSSSATGKGGFVGAVNGDVFTSSYWDKDKSGMATSAGGAVGKTSVQMSQASTFAGWGISTNGGSDANVWRIYEGSSTPLLKFLMGSGNVQQQDITTTYNGYDQSGLVTSGMNTVSNLTYNSFFGSLLDLSGAGLEGGDFSGIPAMINAGTYDVTNALYSHQFGLNIVQDNAGKFVINKAALDFNAIAGNKVYDTTTSANASLTANGLGSDVLTVTGFDAEFSDKNAGIGKTVTIDGITVSGAAAGNYTWGPVTTTADIAKADLSISASGNGKTYDGNTSGSVNFSDNRLGSDDLSISGGAAFADKNAGTGKHMDVSGITVTGDDALNYNWNTSTTATADIAKANLNVSASGGNKTYDGTTAAGTILGDNRIAGDDLVLSSGSSTFSDKNAGTGKTVTIGGITVTGADADNYDWNASTTTIADISKASLNVSASGSNKVYDGNTAAGANLNDNRIGSDDLVVSSSGATFSDKNAGSGKTITVNGITVTGADADNYQWNASTTTTGDIGKATLNVTADGANKIYDGGTSATVSLGDNRIAGDDLVIGSSGSAFADKNAGTGKTITVNGITVSGVDADNYDWNGTTTATADIGKAVLNVGAIGQDKTYDGSSTAGVTFSDDRIAGDNLVISSGSSAFSDKNAGTGKAITVGGISVSGGDAQNYEWNAAASTTGNISKAVLNISASGQDKVYDGSTSAGVVLSDDRIAGDDLSISGSSSFSDKNAGAGKVINVGGFTVSGADAQNYSWNSVTTATATITKALLNVFANAKDKSYDGTNNAQVTLGDDRIAGDNLTLSSGSAEFSDKNSGAGKTVTVGGITVGGADADNYTFNTTANAQADIAKANLVIKADNGSKVEGSADGHFGWNVQSGNLFAGDSIDGSLARNAGEDAGLYAINQGDLTAGSNYELSVVPGVFEITQAVKPPVIVDPIEPPVVVDPIEPPVVVDPIEPPVVVDPIEPPVVIDPPTPPVVVPPKPPVNEELEHTKDIVSTISVAVKVTNSTSTPDARPKDDAGGVKSDYRLLNLGMKLPDDLSSEEGATF